MKVETLPDVHSRIVMLFLEKIELLTEQERATIRMTIDLINHPVFITNRN